MSTLEDIRADADHEDERNKRDAIADACGLVKWDDEYVGTHEQWHKFEQELKELEN